ncbi:hypothetical protein [Dyella sp. ASV21]|uniref:hypothetical protein n=1 Tax=Dyella sp. ASV21 TaxID=2795114 RepID=UPI0018EA9399|nr:hypothetical protein [Dyella sp. ASV21]
MEGRRRFAAVAVVAACSCGLPFVATQADTAQITADAPALHGVSDAQWAHLFDAQRSLAERQQWLADVERNAATADDHTLYLLGTLYHMGQHAPGSPVQADNAKAALYFANAALRGHVMAMAKMAELKYASGEFREAMNWAQIYAHYAPLAGNLGPAAQSYAGELVLRIQANLDPSALDAIMKDVGQFIAANDAVIRAGMATPGAPSDLHPTTHKRHYASTPNERPPGAGIADYLVSFGTDGHADTVLLLDVAPQLDLGQVMRGYVASMSVAPLTGGDAHATRYAWIPVVMGDRQYHNWSRPKTRSP